MSNPVLQIESLDPNKQRVKNPSSYKINTLYDISRIVKVGRLSLSLPAENVALDSQKNYRIAYPHNYYEYVDYMPEIYNVFIPFNNTTTINLNAYAKGVPYGGVNDSFFFDSLQANACALYITPTELVLFVQRRYYVPIPFPPPPANLAFSAFTVYVDYTLTPNVIGKEVDYTRIREV